jgi:hypothetical protein
MSELMRLFGRDGFVSRHPEIHPTEPSARNYLTHHKEHLVRAGALVLHGKEWHVRPSVYARTVLEIAEERARRAVGITE